MRSKTQEASQLLPSFAWVSCGEGELPTQLDCKYFPQITIFWGLILSIQLISFLSL